MSELVCNEVAQKWRECIEENLVSKGISTLCAEQRQVFDHCVDSWREKVGPKVQIKGANEGEPAPQCEGFSCLIGSCLRSTSYNFDRCKPHMEFFKHCSGRFYGGEYVV